MTITKQHISLALCVVIPLLVLAIPTESITFMELSVIEHRVVAIFLMAALLWIMEPIPVFATSLLIITSLALTVSNQGLRMITHTADGVPLPDLMPYTSIFASFANPIIILFMGGFALAIAASKYELDNNLARVLLKPFGESVPIVMLGIMLITAVFSMFMSNTATTVMMLAIVGPIIAKAPKGDLAMKGLVLAIPVAANTGGIGTPIGTPPNAIAVGALGDALGSTNQISFLDWMSFGVPFVIVQLAIAWFVLCKFYPAKGKKIEINMEGSFQRSPRAYLVYATFAITILLWLTGKFHGINSNVVAIIPLTVFCLSGIITKDDLKLFNWDVLWLVAGGIAMGYALGASGLAKNMVDAIDFTALSTYVVIITMSLLCITMANFMSNTATAALIMPIALTVAIGLTGVDPATGEAVVAAGQQGTITVFLSIVALSASLGMMLPVSTPPNSLAYSTGFIETKDLLKVGGVIGATGLALLYAAMMVIM